VNSQCARRLTCSKSYGDKALEQSRNRIDELAANRDHGGTQTCRRIATAVEQLANTYTARTAALTNGNLRASHQ
jgi:hypothetical protein